MMDIKWQTYFDFNDTDTILGSKLRITYTYWSYSTEITRFDYWAELYYQTAWNQDVVNVATIAIIYTCFVEF